MADDYSADISTIGTISVGGSSTGVIDFNQDRDWFKVSLVARQAYVIDLERVESHSVFFDTVVTGIFDSNGTFISGSGGGFNTPMNFVTPTSGTYYISAGAGWLNTGSYILSVVAAVAPANDLVANISTVGAISVGGSQTGLINYVGDVDWFRVSLIAGQTYVVDVSGLSSGNGSLIKPDLVGIYDWRGTFIPGTYTNVGGVGADSQLYFVAPTTDAYYIAAGGNYSSGTYTISIAFTALDLNELQLDDDPRGFVINGPSNSVFAGRVVSNAGDVNGDGLDDIIIGDPFDSAPLDNFSAAYVVFGKTDGTSIELSDIEQGVGGFAINGVTAGDATGNSVSSAGDINGDGLDDLIVGNRSDDTNGSHAGAAYVVFGKVDGTAVEVSDVEAGIGGFSILGVHKDSQAGRSVSGAGDVNGDGLDDVIIGAPRDGASNDLGDSGAAYVVFGKADGATVQLSDVLVGNGGFAITGNSHLMKLGYSVSGAGDVNGDGLDDLFVAAPTRIIVDGVDRGGTYYVVFGKADGAAVEVSDLTAGIGGFAINGVGGNSQGNLVSGAGDVNGDGLDDLIIGSSAQSPNGDFSGALYVVFGKADGATIELFQLQQNDDNRGFVINGELEVDLAGFSVSGAGDVNGDGLDDLIVGAKGAELNKGSTGAAFVVFGKTDGTAVELGDIGRSIGGFGITGGAYGYNNGILSVSGAGDVNADGFDDLIVGAPGADPNGSQTGASYVIFGGPNLANSGDPNKGTPGNDILNGTPSNDQLFGFGGDDELFGNGGDDLLVPGPSDIFANGPSGGGAQNWIGWQAVGLGDLNQDGESNDIFWWNDQDGRTRATIMQDNAAPSNTEVKAPVSAAWKAVGLGDYDNDGNADDVFWWRTSDGATVLWHLENGVYDSYSWTKQPVGTQWQLMGVGDYDGDGTEDEVFWWRTTDGATVLWHLEDGAYKDYTWVKRPVGVDWKVIGIGDFDGDGKQEEVFWWRQSDGATVLWQLENGIYDEYTWVKRPAGTDWTAIDAGDFNGNGIEDNVLWWRQSDGATVLWNLKDGVYDTYTFVNRAFDTDWKPVDMRDTDGDGNQDDLFWTNVNTGDTMVWNLQGGVYAGAPAALPSGGDILTGGPGDDLFVFKDGDGKNTVTDFTAGAGTDDQLDIAAFNFANFAAVQAATTDEGPNTTIALDGDDSVTLLNVQLADLHQDDFLLV